MLHGQILVLEEEEEGTVQSVRQDCQRDVLFHSLNLPTTSRGKSRSRRIRFDSLSLVRGEPEEFFISFSVRLIIHSLCTDVAEEEQLPETKKRMTLTFSLNEYHDGGGRNWDWNRTQVEPENE